jgi:hypothetical protein
LYLLVVLGGSAAAATALVYSTKKTAEMATRCNARSVTGKSWVRTSAAPPLGHGENLSRAPKEYSEVRLLVGGWVDLVNATLALLCFVRRSELLN